MQPTPKELRALQLRQFEALLRLESYRLDEEKWELARQLQREGQLSSRYDLETVDFLDLFVGVVLPDGNNDKLIELNGNLQQYNLKVGEECLVSTVDDKWVVEIARVNGQNHGS
tara:strand:+ start:869 stop:1210 length:342 start_codon:yes stop_codon:yes gene_type:complete